MLGTKLHSPPLESYVAALIPLVTVFGGRASRR